jgi:signal transduction histidine kinase
MTLRSKLAVVLVSLAAILVIPLVMAIQSLSGLGENARTLRDRDFAASLLLGRLREEVTMVQKIENAILFLEEPRDREDAIDRMVRQVSLLSRLADSVAHFEIPAATDIRSAVGELALWAPREIEAARARQPLADTIARQRIAPALARADSGLQIAERDLRSRTIRRVQETTEGIDATRAAAVAGVALALGGAAIIAFVFARSITRPVTALDRGMHAVAEGDFTIRVPLDPERNDEFGHLAQSFNEMTRQLAELDKLKAEFISVASHELKTPVNVIIGYMQLLDEGIYGELPPKQKEIHRTIEIQAQTLLRLTRQLLDVSRFEAGGGRLDIRRIVLSEFLEELEKSFQGLAVQRGIAFTVQASDSLPVEVYWDLDRVNEVLGNLLSNAFKFTPRGGRVELKAEPVNGAIMMAVRDTGAGIPPEQLPRIFEKFYQADNQRAADAAGSGLGLAIAKQIVEAHGGSIRCESTVGTGTTFTLVLPTRSTRRSSSHHIRPAGVA